MKVKNYKGVEFDVTLNKWFHFDDCSPFKLLKETDVPQAFQEFFRLPIRVNVANVGCVIVVENMAKDLVESGYQLPCYIPQDEFECNTIYKHIENGECI
jgi:hypothetical protein